LVRIVIYFINVFIKQYSELPSSGIN